MASTKLSVKGRYVTEKNEDGIQKEMEVEVDLGALIDVVNATFDVIKAGVRGGQASHHLALLHSLLFADLLHGGAYKAPIRTLPYYQPGNWVNAAGIALTWSGDKSNLPLIFPVGAAIEDQEAIINGDVPHVLPKLIKDITWGTVHGWVNKFNTIEAIGNAATAVSTIVETVEGAVQTAATGGFGTEGITAQAQLLQAQTRSMVASREGKEKS